MLEPLSADHLDGLTEIGLEPAIWRWMPLTMTSRADLQGFIATALTGQAAGREQPFSTVE